MIGSAHRGEASGPDRGHRTRPGERNPRDVALDAEEPPGRQPMRYRRSTACASWPSIGQRNAAQAPSVWLSETSDRDSCRAELRAVGWTAAGAALHAFILTCACRRLLRTRFGNAALIPAGYLNYVPNLLNTLVCDQVIRPVTWRHSKMLRVLQQHHSCAMLRCRAGKGLRRRRSQPGTVSESAQGRCRDYQDASVGRPRQARTEPTMTGPRPRCPVAK
jgi:hypothetical protein